VKHNEELEKEGNTKNSIITKVVVDISRQKSSYRNASKHENVNDSNSCGSVSGTCDIRHVGINPNKEAIEAPKDAEDAIDKQVVGRPVNEDTATLSGNPK